MLSKLVWKYKLWRKKHIWFYLLLLLFEHVFTCIIWVYCFSRYTWWTSYLIYDNSDFSKYTLLYLLVCYKSLCVRGYFLRRIYKDEITSWDPLKEPTTWIFTTSLLILYVIIVYIIYIYNCNPLKEPTRIFTTSVLLSLKRASSITYSICACLKHLLRWCIFFGFASISSRGHRYYWLTEGMIHGFISK